VRAFGAPPPCVRIGERHRVQTTSPANVTRLRSGWIGQHVPIWSPLRVSTGRRGPWPTSPDGRRSRSVKVGESALCIAMVASGAIAATEADYHPAARWLSGLTRRAVTNAPQTSCPPPSRATAALLMPRRWCRRRRHDHALWREILGDREAAAGPVRFEDRLTQMAQAPESVSTKRAKPKYRAISAT
jgi:hypothetical protein